MDCLVHNPYQLDLTGRRRAPVLPRRGNRAKFRAFQRPSEESKTTAIRRSEWGKESEMLTPESFGSIAFVVFGGMLLLGLAGVGVRLAELRNRIAALSRIETKLDLLLTQARIKFDPYANLPGEIAEAVRAGRTINAIKLYRQSSGVGLKEAKEFVEEVERRLSNKSSTP